jgi:hypothetical protein
MPKGQSRWSEYCAGYTRSGRSPVPATNTEWDLQKKCSSRFANVLRYVEIMAYSPTRRPGLLQSTIIFVLFCAAADASAGTKLNFWHSYTHQPSGVTHYSFHIANYKRGLFFGSCGPSTRSLQWEYDVDLVGIGPIYSKDHITITIEGKSVEVVSGTIAINTEGQTAKIDLRINYERSATDFAGNGTHHIKKINKPA